jgi:FHS family L-fucose permease-like MFS transporter
MNTNVSRAAGIASSRPSALARSTLFSREYTLPFVLVTALFFLWGIPNNLNDVLIRQFMKSFEITRFQAGLVQSAFYLGYFAFSLPAALIMRRFGYKTGLVTGLVLYGSGTLLFWPAAIIAKYGFFLLALFVIASGLAFLETGASPFIAQLGDPATSERRLNFSQAFNPLGAIAGVLVGTTFIFSGVELTRSQTDAMQAAGTLDAYLHQETMRVIRPYLILGCVVFLWAVLIGRTKVPEIAEEGLPTDTANQGSFRQLFRYSHFVQAVLAQFFYVGAQVGTWSYFIQYVQDYVHESEKAAGYFLSGTLVAFAVGRFAATYLMRFVEPKLLMGAYSIANIVLVGIGILFPGWLGLWAVFLTSFFMSLMFPTIFALGLKGLGPNTKVAASFLVMAIIGGAVFTPLMGLVFEAAKSMATAMLVPLGCYIFIAHFAFFGSQVRTPVTVHAPAI